MLNAVGQFKPKLNYSFSDVKIQCIIILEKPVICRQRKLIWYQFEREKATFSCHFLCMSVQEKSSLITHLGRRMPGGTKLTSFTIGEVGKSYCSPALPSFASLSFMVFVLSCNKF